MLFLKSNVICISCRRLEFIHNFFSDLALPSFAGYCIYDSDQRDWIKSQESTSASECQDCGNEISGSTCYIMPGKLFCYITIYL